MGNVSCHEQLYSRLRETMHATVASRNIAHRQRALPNAHGTNSVWRAALQEMPISLLGHPPGAREMAFPGPPSAVMFPRRIDMQDDLRNFLPIRAVGFRVEQAEIDDGMSLIVPG
jgi:hypothetical protein